MRHMPPPMPAAHSSRRLAATATAVDTGSPAAATPSPSLLPLSRGALQPSPPPPRRGATVATTVAATVATTVAAPVAAPVAVAVGAADAADQRRTLHAVLYKHAPEARRVQDRLVPRLLHHLPASYLTPAASRC